MYLYAERQNGRKLGGQRVPAGDMNPATTRALLEKHFPGARVLSPLEPAVSFKQDGSIEVITVYGTRSADGRNRCTGIEQWGIQGHTAIYKCSICGEAHPTAYHNHPAGPLSQEQIRHMSDHVRRWTYKYLLESTAMQESAEIAEAAALQYARELERTTSKGVTK